MKKITLNSRRLARKVTFSRPGGRYIYVDLNGEDGTLGNQICEGGSLMGETLGYSGESQEVFEEICRSWYRSHIRNLVG